MMIQLKPVTRLAIQAAMAVFLTELLSHYLKLDRPYWAILTALLLISQTWGESIKRAIERVAMTIAGGAVGTGIYFIVSGHPHGLILMLVIAVFFMVYYIGYSYLLAVFFTMIFLVFLFAIISNWNVHIFEVRILDTLIGAAVAIFISAFIFPLRAQTALTNLFDQFLEKIMFILEFSEKMLASQLAVNGIEELRDGLLKNYNTLVQQVSITNYELFFSLYPRKKLNAILGQLQLLVHYTTSLLEVSAMLPQNLTAQIDDLQTIVMQVVTNVKTLQEKLTQKKATTKILVITKAADKILLKIVHNGIEEKDMLLYVSYIYFLKKVNELLVEIHRIAE